MSRLCAQLLVVGPPVALPQNAVGRRTAFAPALARAMANRSQKKPEFITAPRGRRGIARGLRRPGIRRWSCMQDQTKPKPKPKPQLYSALSSERLEAYRRRLGVGDDDTASVIAELSFGFWASLLDRRYEQVLWPRLLRAVFPFVPRRNRTRQALSRRIQALRVLRNRVFHYEPIWHWHDLKNQHSQLVEAIGWVAPAAATLLAVVDRFPDVHARGQGSWDKAVSAVLNGDIGC